VQIEEDLSGPTGDLCEQRLATAQLEGITAVFRDLGVDRPRAAALLEAVDEVPAASHIRAAKQAVEAAGISVAGGDVERCLILTGALHKLRELPHLPVSRRVRALLCEELAWVASAPTAEFARCGVGTARFVRLAKIATHTRWPAGQFEWEISGIPRSDVLRVDPLLLPGTLAFLAWRLRGLGPVFFSHLNPRRPHRALLEDEANRSYFQMAQAMEQQPAIRGFAACSWFRSPETQRVSPHLAWLSRVFLENGGWVVDAGKAGADCGALYRSSTRRALYEAGRFTPRKGLVVWPRRAMLGWAAAHPELAGPSPLEAQVG